MDAQPFLSALFPWFPKGISRINRSTEEKFETCAATELNGGAIPSLLDSTTLLNVLEINKLRVNTRCATLGGETIYLVLVNPLEEEDLEDLAAYLDVWWKSDYCQICILLNPRLETVGHRGTLAGRGVDRSNSPKDPQPLTVFCSWCKRPDMPISHPFSTICDECILIHL
jgi:hypothetical protein